MFGCLAVHHNLLFIGSSEGSGRVLVIDAETGEERHQFMFAGEATGKADAAGLAVDADSRVFVADTRNRTVRIFSVFGSEVGRLDAQNAEAGERSDRRGSLGRPHDLALDDEGRLFVCSGLADRVHSVQCFLPDGTWVRTFHAGADPQAVWAAPRGITVVGEALYVAETGRGRIHAMRTDGASLGSVAATGDSGEPAAPVAVAVLPGGDLAVALWGEPSRVVRFDASLRPRGVLIRGGDAEGLVRDPFDLAVDLAGRLLVADKGGTRVQAFSDKGEHLGVVWRLQKVRG